MVQFTFLRLEENWNAEEGKCSFLGGNRQEVSLKMDILDLATNACHAKWARVKNCLPAVRTVEKEKLLVIDRLCTVRTTVGVGAWKPMNDSELYFERGKAVCSMSRSVPFFIWFS